MSYTPTVRPPTGIPAAPLIMVSGPAKSGKSLTSYKLGLSDRIDNCWVCDLGEGSADEYGDLGGYSVLDWGRSWSDLADTVRWCVAQQPAEGKLNALIIDSGTEMWDALKDRASQRARSSQKNRKALEADPDAEIDVSMNYWNDAANTWGKIIGPLKLAANLVGVVLVRADEVAEMANGAPTKNRVISLQAHKSLPAVVTAHVQVRPDHSAHLIEVRSMRVSVPPRGQRLGDNPLSEVLDLLSPAGGFAAPMVNTPTDEDEVDPVEAATKALWARLTTLDDLAKQRFRDWCVEQNMKVPTAKALADSAPLRKQVTEWLDEPVQPTLEAVS